MKWKTHPKEQVDERFARRLKGQKSGTGRASQLVLEKVGALRPDEPGFAQGGACRRAPPGRRSVFLRAFRESASSGLVEKSTTVALRKQIADLSMKLGEIHARLQRAPNFPAKLKEFTRFQIQKMHDSKNFSIASKKEFQTALKLLKEAANENSRLLQKL
jgi:hypothetical protein